MLDVRDAADQHRFAAEVREWLPSLPNAAPLAAVFNNAGVAVASSVLDADPDDDEWLRQINFDGVVNGTRAFLPILVEQDDGVIVNTSSVFGLLGMPDNGTYCASKFAVRGFTEALRQELRGPASGGDRPPWRHQDQHRARQPHPEGPDGPRAHPRADGGRLRGDHHDHAGQGGGDHLPRD